MSSNVVTLSRLFRRNWDWTSQELAEFYRVETALLQAGLRIDTERGVSDDGDPWFAFCRQEDGEVIVHIARIEGDYILAGSSYEGIARGRDISALVRDLVARHPLVQMPGAKSGRGSNVFLHPAALLVAIVATAFFKSSEARALSADDGEPSQGRGGQNAASMKAPTPSGEALHNTIAMDAAQLALILTAVSSLFDDGSKLSTDPVGADHHVGADHNDHPDIAQAPGLPSSLLSPGAGGPSSLLLANAEKSDGSGGAEIAQTQSVDVKALPLVAVLWDLSSQHIAHKSGADDVPSSYLNSSEGAHGAVELAELPGRPLLVITMIPANGVAGSLPAVQSAKISFSGGDGTVQTHEIQHLDQLPTALTVVLQAAVHTSVEGVPVGGPSGSTSFADTLIAALSSGATTNATVATTTDPATPNTVVSPTAEGTATNHGVAVNAVDLQAILENFIQRTADYSIISTGKGLVVVYDVHALMTDIADVKTVSFDFGDGSSLSLVGLPVALPHAYMMA